MSGPLRVAPTDGKAFAQLEERSKVPRVLDPLFLATQNNVITNAMLLAYMAVIDRLPLASYSLDWPQSGALIGYGPDNAQIYRRAGYYINAILKGANAGDLAVELPTSSNLAVNLKTAKALGLTVPPSLIGVATEVIE